MKTRLSLLVIALCFAGVNLYAQSEATACHPAKTDSASHIKAEVMNHDTQAATVTEAPETSTAWNAVCPVMGGKVNPKAHKASYKDKVYGFCCNGCDKKFTKDPEKYSANLSEDGKEFISENQ